MGADTRLATGTAITTMPTEAGLPLLRLLHLVSPSLPVGAFTYSQGIEWAVEAGWIRDAADLQEWLADQLDTTLARLDLPLLLFVQLPLVLVQLKLRLSRFTGVILRLLKDSLIPGLHLVLKVRIIRVRHWRDFGPLVLRYFLFQLLKLSGVLLCPLSLFVELGGFLGNGLVKNLLLPFVKLYLTFAFLLL